jgi:diadenosine tetraphosphatase ApaH/serine/threonine PP2A family protein phosphatase
VRVAVLSDIHANLVALEAVLTAVGTIDAVWHLGDVVGYGSEPDAVVERLAGAGALGVAGNHDLAALGGPEIEWFNPDARAAMEWTRRRIDERTRAWLAALPTTREESGVTLVHGSPRDPVWEYVTTLAVARTNLEVMETALGLHGHTHQPIAWADRDGRVEALAPRPASTLSLGGRRALLNPGSVGQPRDGDPRASYAVLDVDRATVDFHRVAYDVPETQKRMRALKLPDMLAERLAFGL